MSETIYDQVTALMWQNSFGSHGQDQATLAAANTFCNNLVHAGTDDWRVPSRLELLSVLDYGQYSPALEVGTFGGAAGPAFWVASAGPPASQWTPNLSNGTLDLQAEQWKSLVCVRGPAFLAGSGEYNSVSLGAVLDQRTGLLWQRQAASAQGWLSALTYCNDLGLDSASDWRLPSVKELSTLALETPPTATFTDLVSDSNPEYWTSSPRKWDQNTAWTVEFSTTALSRVTGKNVDTALRVRCVR